jgi:hypothetical protein
MFGNDPYFYAIFCEVSFLESKLTDQEFTAKAYTIGDNIVIGKNRYAPNTTEGKRLLAHELTQTQISLWNVWSPTVAAADM